METEIQRKDSHQVISQVNKITADRGKKADKKSAKGKKKNDLDFLNMKR